MSKDIVQEALDNAKAMREAALDNAKRTLVDAMSNNLKTVVAEAIEEQINEEKEIPGDYHEGKKGKNLGTDRMGDEIPATGDTGDDLTGEGDGPAIVEAGIEEEEDMEEEDMEETEDMDEEDMPEEEDMEEGGYEEEDDMEEGGYEEGEEEMDMGDEEDDDADDLDSDDDDDMDEVIEITEEDDDDDDMDEEVTAEEIVGEMVKLDRENKQLRKENAKLSKAIKMLNGRIDEVNLFNARLAATSELMRKVTLTKEEKERAINILDSANNINEVKRSYKALYEGYRAGGRQVKSTNRVNRRPVHSVVTESAKKTVIEEGTVNNVETDRLARLAGIQ